MIHAAALIVTTQTRRSNLDILNDMLRYEARIDVWLYNWWGHDADPTKAMKYSNFKMDDFQVKPLEFPTCPGFLNIKRDRKRGLP